ncbi:MAG: hypothetical protein A2498_14100 [Lentisphaerae bacterium RIFOXYC12_FULL_60_16]|nr:MAG: hypothetical protein A2498_14100 [Lentisphaerae bacterium RIFOXYC12_FULL_60_16]OGV73751.1 MAG: hypothetical protein A2269_04610 [Lentisphaerae bacterium RIFOXYA12_FULL_60_10]
MSPHNGHPNHEHMPRRGVIATLAMMAAGLCLLFPAGCGNEKALSFRQAQITHIRQSVVKVYVTIQRPDYRMPWQGGRPGGGTGTGFLIAGRRILTNAHIISDASQIQVQKDGDSRLWPARVAAVAHDCDLALLTVDDPVFFESMSHLPIAESMPTLNDEVTVYGYPLGGDRLSITRGVVSRLDYGVYVHSGVDQHLVMQVDAAINPGNSGGPVIFRKQVVGVAFQGLEMAENIGYVIPVPVVRRFLEDMQDDQYHGYPELGALCFSRRNEALMKALQLPATDNGPVVMYVDPYGNAYGRLNARDVLLTIDDHPIQDDGTVLMNGNSVDFHEIIELKQHGTTVRFEVWRDMQRITVEVPLSVPDDPFIFRTRYDQTPECVMMAGLVFTVLTRNHFTLLGRDWSDRYAAQWLYFSQYAKMDNLYKQFDEFVVLSNILPHPVNTHCHGFRHGIVTGANGHPVRNLADLRQALESPTNGFHIIQFAGLQDWMVLPADEVRKAETEIASSYELPDPEAP